MFEIYQKMCISVLPISPSENPILTKGHPANTLRGTSHREHMSGRTIYAKSYDFVNYVLNITYNKFDSL